MQVLLNNAPSEVRNAWPKADIGKKLPFAVSWYSLQYLSNFTPSNHRTDCITLTRRPEGPYLLSHIPRLIASFHFFNLAESCEYLSLPKCSIWVNGLKGILKQLLAAKEVRKRNWLHTKVRVFKTIEHYGDDLTRCAENGIQDTLKSVLPNRIQSKSVWILDYLKINHPLEHKTPAILTH